MIRSRERPRRGGATEKKESRNFLVDDLHPSRENRTAKPLSYARSSATFHPLLSDNWQCGRSAALPLPSLRSSPLLFCISTRNFPFFFIILFIFLANHSDPAAVCLPMQMQRVGASCFFRLGFANPRLMYVLQYRPSSHPPTLPFVSFFFYWCLNIISN